MREATPAPTRVEAVTIPAPTQSQKTVIPSPTSSVPLEGSASPAFPKGGVPPPAARALAFGVVGVGNGPDWTSAGPPRTTGSAAGAVTVVAVVVGSVVETVVGSVVGTVVGSVVGMVVGSVVGTVVSTGAVVALTSTAAGVSFPPTMTTGADADVTGVGVGVAFSAGVVGTAVPVADGWMVIPGGKVGTVPAAAVIVAVGLICAVVAVMVAVGVFVVAA
jgi:hypothetical protein